MIRRPYRPGQHGQKRQRRISDYGRQLQEKQKIQIVYGLTNKQMRNLFREHAGDPQTIVRVLEKRLDRVVYLLGIAPSSRVGRQIVSHGHIIVNGRKVTIPSYKVRVGDVVGIRLQSRKSKLFEDLETRFKKFEPPSWLELDGEKAEGKCVGNPLENAIEPFDINLVSEYYTR